MNNDSDTTPSLISLIRWKKWSSVLERLKSHPDETQSADKHGRLPLHAACKEKAPIEVIKELLRIHPHAAQGKTNWRQLPLHYLFGRVEDDPVAPSEDVAELVIDAYPSAASARDMRGDFPLLYASGNGAMSPKPLKKLIAAYPEAAGIRSGYGTFPLHLACCRWVKNCDICEMLGALLEAYPEAVSAKDEVKVSTKDEVQELGNLPLHMFTSSIWISGPNHENMKAFNLIMGANTKAANTANNAGCLPLHYVCQDEPKEMSCFYEEFFDTIIKANPAAASTADCSGRLPLHYACMYWSTNCRKMFSKLMGANPEAIHTVDNEGRNPLDLAYKRNNSQEFVSMLFSASPTGVLLQRLEQSRSLNQKLTVWLAAATKRVRELEDESKIAKKSKQSA